MSIASALGGPIDTMERTWSFWSGAMSGDGFQVVNPPGAWEQIDGQKYDVAQVVQQYQRKWLGVTPNHATPIDMLDLLYYLDDFTRVLEEEDRARRMPSVGLTPRACKDFEVSDPGYGQLCTDLERWRNRLDEYLMFVASVPAEQENDRRTILWEVTAPLFVGWYGGETGSEVALPAAAFPPGFDPNVRHPADIGTPYSLANQFGIWVAWQDERRDRLVEELTDPLKPKPLDYGVAILIGAALLGGALLLRR